jgi:cytochrome oxidase assembly protein ShyY1
VPLRRKRGTKEKFSIFKSVVALILIAGCLVAAQWQFERGIARKDRNDLIAAQSALAPVQLNEIVSTVEDHEWKSVTTRGTFDVDRQILLRNRYFEGQYGFEVLTAFTSVEGTLFWVDRGWVKAGASAVITPDVPIPPQGEVEILGRVRLDTSLPQGNFFALPSDGTGLISEANAQSSNSDVGIDSKFYLDLVSGNLPELTPAVPAELPELSDGPHFAYSLQWIIFGGLVVYGRFLIRREVLTRKEL